LRNGASHGAPVDHTAQKNRRRWVAVIEHSAFVRSDINRDP
jgi:hypothetical protein